MFIKRKLSFPGGGGEGGGEFFKFEKAFLRTIFLKKKRKKGLKGNQKTRGEMLWFKIS